MDNPFISFKSENYINSNNFLNFSDTFYSAYIQDEDLNKLYNNDYKILLRENGSTFVKMHSFKIKENDVIFCHTMLVEQLFEHLNEIKDFKNIKLITHQSDISVGKHLFKKKPKCVSKWYSTNVTYEHQDLIPIPIGIGNDSNLKTLNSKQFIKNKIRNEKMFGVYSNFNLNTNYFHRFNALNRNLDKKIFLVEKPSADISNYLHNLLKYKFTLTPWGNGYDTHRMWEAIYAGSIPITKKHISYVNFKDLPIIFLKNYKSINKNEIEKFDFFYHEKLNMQWWKKLIANKVLEEKSDEVLIVESKEIQDKNITKFYKDYKKLNRYKLIKTILRKIHKKILGRKLDDYFGL